MNFLISKLSHPKLSRCVLSSILYSRPAFNNKSSQTAYIVLIDSILLANKNQVTLIICGFVQSGGWKIHKFATRKRKKINIFSQIQHSWQNPKSLNNNVWKWGSRIFNITMQTRTWFWRFTCDIQSWSNDLKVLDTFGNCQRPVFSLGVSQHYA